METDTISFTHDMTKKGWRLVDDFSYPKDISVANLELIPFSNRSEVLSGAKMREEAKRMNANLGQYHAEFLLKHQREIPKEWKNYLLVFPGTVWQLGKSLVVPFLGWGSKHWFLDFYWLEHNWPSHFRFVRPS